MNQTEKAVVIDELAAKFGNAPLVALSQYRGLTVAQMTDLRGQLRPDEAELLSAKNTLVWRAVMETPNKVVEPLPSGPNVFTLRYGHPVAFAKVIPPYAGKTD